MRCYHDLLIKDTTHCRLGERIQGSSFHSYPSLQHQYKVMTSKRLQSLMQCSDADTLFKYDFPSVLKPRVPGTQSHEEVKDVCHVICRCMSCDVFRCMSCDVQVHVM